MRRMMTCLLALIAMVLVSHVVCIYAAGDTTGKPAPLEENRNAIAREYIIGNGDVLDITVWREPMLTGEALVRNDGMISVALLGDLKAAGRTPMDLRDEIQRRLKDFLAEPSVTVSVKTPASQKFYVIGEVRTPGEYDLVKDLTVVQAIARAGGFSEWATKDEIFLLRKENGIEKRIKINYKDIVKGKDGGQNQALKANDTIVVP